MSATVSGRKAEVFGEGSRDANLGRSQIRRIVAQTLETIAPGSRVLAIVPDKTRDDITDLLLPMAIDELADKRLEKFQILVAQGTHAPMTELEKNAKSGREAWADWAKGTCIEDHRWDDPDELIQLGEIGSETVSSITEGVYTESVKVTVNRRLSPANCDFAIIFGGVVPHEVAGFSGGAKYLFPGVSGRELTNVTHWIGALAGIENVIGRIETPVRKLIETAADMVPARILCFSSVVTRDEDDMIRTHGLFGGAVRESFRAAAAVSQQVHIRRTGRKFPRVVALLEDHYDELWTGGKASYKLGGVIEDGGELIIHAPKLAEFSRTHGARIEKFGYRPIEAIKEMVDRTPELREDLCVAAHLAHVSYGSRRNGEAERVARFRITLSSAIDKERCEAANLSFLDCEEFDLENYRDDPDTLVVERAGRDLYLI